MLHDGGPAVLRGGVGRDARLSKDLRSALSEYAEVAEAVLRSGDDQEVDLLRRRGRQLASRVADSLGRTVEFIDPVSGEIEAIGAVTPTNGTPVAARAAVFPGTAEPPVPPDAPVFNGRVPAAPVSAGSDAPVSDAPVSDASVSDASVSDASVSDASGLLAPEPPGPTPWGTGSAVATFVAVLVALADIVLARAFAGAFGLLWVPANLLVTGGTIPSLWLAREVPFWRWPAFGAAAGLGAAWIVMLLGLLGS